VVVTVEAGTNYSDAGAGAVDGYDGDLTESMEVTDGVDILAVGSYKVSYNVSDAAGNAAVPVIRTVIVVDTTPPVIALVGEAIVTIEAGSIYEDAGVQANDTGDGDLSSKIELVSTVNTDKLGEYTVTYTVSDSSGNEAVEVNRVVKVVDTTAPVITLNGDVVVTVEAGTNYSDAGAGAVDGYDGDLTESMEVTDGVDILAVGSYKVSYNVSDAAGNAAVPVIRTVIVVDTTPPVIALVGEAIVTIEAGSIYEDAGVQANDTGDGDLSSKIELVSTVNTDKLGEYTVTYTVSDSSGNEAVEVNRVVKVVDTTAPVITLNGDVVVTVEAGTNYSDAGAGAVDGYDGDLTESMEVTDGVDILAVGSYKVSYNVSDAAGNAAVPVIRTVIVVDTTPPVIALVGEAIVTIEAGSIYEDAGVQANDTGDGDLSSKIELVSTVNTDKLGEYTVTYTVSDSSGNEAVEVNRVVKVVDTTAPVITLNGDVVVTVEAGTNYSDAGAGAVDGYDGDLTESMEVTDGVDILAVGSYKVSYNVSDAAGNAAVPVIRTVIVVDTTPPVIALVGEAIVTVEAGSIYEDAGAVANDSVDGDLTSKVKVAGKVDVQKVGEYQLKYNVEDASGNKSLELTRRVIVETSIKETIHIEKYNSAPFWFEFKSKKEKSYAIESSTDLREWKGINVIKGTGAIIRFEDERDQIFLQMYYRVRMID
ncbi:MAG: immunoglobulin-like domain-containing protein, partial [Verrucomicrobiales bacterium]